MTKAEIEVAKRKGREIRYIVLSGGSTIAYAWPPLYNYPSAG